MDASELFYTYDGVQYPHYLKSGNAARFIEPVALEICQGVGLDVGAGKWPLVGAIPIELKDGGDAYNLPDGTYDYIFSSHCLEHLHDPVKALLHWKTRIKPGGVLFLYLPHPEMVYWRPTRNRKHLHSWQPEEMVQIMLDVGFSNIIHSQRDMEWSFACFGVKG